MLPVPDDRPPKPQLRLVKSEDDEAPRELQSRVEQDYRRSQLFRKADQLIYRVLQLHDILDVRLKEGDDVQGLQRQIWETQRELDRVFNRLS